MPSASAVVAVVQAVASPGYGFPTQLAAPVGGSEVTAPQPDMNWRRAPAAGQDDPATGDGSTALGSSDRSINQHTITRA